MKKLLKKINLKRLPLIFLVVVFSVTFLLGLYANKYIFALIAFGIIYLLSFKCSIKKFPWFLFLFSMLSKILVILVFKPPIESDFYTMYRASSMLKLGDLSYAKLPYFISWGYQTGHVAYQALLLKIWDSVFFLKLVNCLALSCTTVLIYLTTKELINEKVAKFTSLSYMIYLHPVMLTTILTNQHIPTFLFFLGLYLIIKDNLLNNKVWLKYLIVGLLIGLGNIMRPEGIIFVLAIIVYLLLNKCQKAHLKTIFINIVVLIASYLIITNGCSLAFKAFNISQNGLKNMDPLWKFVLGTNYDSRGWYTSDDSKYLGDREKELEVIKERTIGNPTKFLKLMMIKTKSFWLDSNLYWSNTYLNSNDLKVGSFKIKGSTVNAYMFKFNQHVYLVIFTLSLIGIFSLVKEKSYNDKINLFVILLCGYWTVYLFIEIMNRYTYTPRVAVFIMAGIGINSIVTFMDSKRKVLNKK